MVIIQSNLLQREDFPQKYIQNARFACQLDVKWRSANTIQSQNSKKFLSIYLIAGKWIHAIPINNNIYYLENYRINLYSFDANFNKMLFSIFFFNFWANKSKTTLSTHTHARRWIRWYLNATKYFIYTPIIAYVCLCTHFAVSFVSVCAQ